MTDNMRWIDPPSGWKYGFPKQINLDILIDEYEGNVAKWLTDNGYPEKDAEFATKYCRWWGINED